MNFPLLGKFFLFFAFLTSLLSIFASFLKEEVSFEIGRRATKSMFTLVSLASLDLLILFLLRDFSVKYVRDYSSTHLPFFYTISAFWAGQPGSLLLWSFFLSGFTYFFLKYEKGKFYERNSLILIGILNLFFLILVNFVSNPFETLDFKPKEGSGLNPLLQHPAMVFHPPFTYLGFVGFSVPFAIYLGALWNGNINVQMLKRVRIWTLIPWIFLTMGIVLGGWWAYEELGWGGYWAWDPVENASLIPWLLSTAFLHSLNTTIRKRIMKKWGTVLIFLTLISVIFGTFLTRSGVVSSVHAFGESQMGNYFLFFMILLFVIFLVVSKNRARLLREETHEIEFFSREKSFSLLNYFFILLSILVVLGTLFPIISELSTGKRLEITQSYYNRTSTPFFMAIIILIGVCGFIRWRKSELVPFLKKTIPALFFSIFAFFLSFSFSKSLMISSLTAISIFGLVGGFQNTIDESIRSSKSSFLLGMRRLFLGIIHLGIPILAIGIIFSSQMRREDVLRIGEEDKKARFENYLLTYKGINIVESPLFTGFEVLLDVERDGKVKELRPGKFFYKNWKDPHARVAILRDGLSDFYLIFAKYEVDKEGEGEYVTLKVMYEPLINLVWIGSLLVVIGAFLTFSIGFALEKNR